MSASHEEVRSADGTPIAFVRVGAGPPVVVVHGTLGSRASWALVAELLADRYELLLVDRRGHGDSGPFRDAHTLAREVEDVRAVLALAGPGAALVGHSYGGAVAFETARAVDPGEVGKLVLYEPPLAFGQTIAPAEDVALIESLVLAGRLEDGLVVFLERVSSLRPEEVASARESLGWPRLVALAPTLPVELAAIRALPRDTVRGRSLSLPVLLVIGELSGARHERTLASLVGDLADHRIARLAGEGHLAPTSNPALLAHVVAEFLE